MDCQNTQDDTSSNEQKHISVLLEESLCALNSNTVSSQNDNPKKFLDCTFGAGGHSRAILQKNENCKLYAIDCDPDAAIRAKNFSKDFPNRFFFSKQNFSTLEDLQADNFAGILMDLGVSSFQLDQASRGFSFRFSGKTDMRLDTQNGQSAIDFLNNISAEQLTKILWRYGEEKNAKKIASIIVQNQNTPVIEDTKILSDLIKSVCPKNFKSKIHPATKSFMAIRIAVNDELGSLEKALPVAFEKLAKGGVLAIITFHSLEDRIVKRFFKQVCGLPIDRFDHSSSQSRIKKATLINRKPILANQNEINLNPRSRSAKLRAITKL